MASTDERIGGSGSRTQDLFVNGAHVSQKSTPLELSFFPTEVPSWRSHLLTFEHYSNATQTNLIAIVKYGYMIKNEAIL